MGANAETYYFTGTDDYADYTDVANWLVGGPDGTAATALPGTGDGLYTLTPIYADMAGGDYSVGKWGFSADWDHKPKPLYVRNGTLRITSDLTTHNGKLIMSDGGNIFVEGNYIPAVWDGGAHEVTVNDGCTYGITGVYRLYKTYVTVKAGGTFLFKPTAFSVYGGSAQSSWYDIYGTMDAPGGVKWTSGNLANDSCTIDFCLRDGGVMRLGSGFSRTPSPGKLRFFWYGGTIKATGAVSFVNTEATIPAGASVYCSIDAGASIDLSGVTFGEGASVTKSGAGDFACTGGMALPETFTVAEGGLVLSEADASYDLSSVKFAAGTTLKLAASGIVLSVFDASIANAEFAAADGFSPANGTTVFTCTDSSILAAAQAGLNATLPAGLSVAVSGNSLVAESHYTFNSTSVTDMTDPDGWHGGVAGVAGQPVIVAGAGVAPVMDADTPAYASIAVRDGASLAIAATRGIPATTLEAGTVLSVANPAVPGSDVAATATGDFATVGSGSATVYVAADCTLDLSGVDVSVEAALVKTGDGAIVFGGELPAGLEVRSGVLAVQPYVEYDMTGIVLGQDATIKVAIDGELKPCMGTPGRNGTTVYIANGTYVGVGGWNETANWANGVIPDASAIVHVHGEGTVLSLDDATATLPAEIVVENGATFAVAADAVLPKLTLEPAAKVVVGDGEASVSATLGAALAASADPDATPVALPVLEVASNATLNVPGGVKFKNVNLRLFGTLAGTSLGKIYFGHADPGETAYFAMCLTNATVRTIGYGSSYDGGALYFACPDAGGAVSVVGTIEIDGMSVERGGGQYDGINFGVNNPVDLPFSVVFENVSYWYMAQCHIAGATELVVRNSYLYRYPNRAWSAQGRWTVENAAKVVYVDSRHFYEYPDGNSIGWSAADEGHESVVLTNTVVQWTRPVGNGKNVMTVFDSYYDCAYDEYAPSQGQTLPDLFRGLGVLNIPSGAFLSIRGKSDVTWGTNGSGTERTCNIDSSVRFAGGGNVRIENAESGKYFAAVMQGGLNTCSGTLSVSSPEGFDARFFFADGANWAGTVAAGNVALTNLAGSAATATFGTLDLSGNFPVRVWTDEGGAVATNDMVNVGEYRNDGGRLTVEAASGDLALAPGEKIVVGTIAKTSPDPAVKAGWRVKRLAIEDDDANEILVLKKGAGLHLIMR